MTKAPLFLALVVQRGDGGMHGSQKTKTIVRFICFCCLVCLFISSGVTIVD